MKSTYSYLLPAVTTLIILGSCRKDNSNKTPNGPPPEKPDLAVTVKASVSGFVSDEQDQAVAFASVTAGDKKITADEYGYFSCSDATLPKDIGLVKVERTGYMTAYRSLYAQEGKVGFVRIKLLTKSETGSFSATAGGTVTSTEGISVNIPAAAVVTAANNAAYAGTVHVSVRSVDPFEARGTNKDGYLKYVQAFSTIAVELSDDAGEKLQIASGKQAKISLPVASALSGIAPATITLWRFNDSTGLWSEEGQATKNGDVYTGTVGHFSYWEAAAGLDVVHFTARVINSSNQPLANVPVSITQASLPQNAGYGKFSYTDADGYVSGAIPANMSLVLDVLTTCAQSSYSHPFNSGNADLDMGTLPGSPGQGMVTISGTATGCNGAAITDGYVQTYDHGFYNRIPVTNGSFSFTGLSCTNAAINYVVVDNSTHRQSEVQSVDLVSGVNNLGAIIACGSSTLATLSYTINGQTTTVTEPDRSPSGYYLDQIDGTQIVVIAPDVNTSPDWSFQMNGGASTGNGHTVTDIWSKGFKSGRAYAPAPLKVTITEYGKIGGWISGSFSGLLLDFEDNTIYNNTSCTFRVRRSN